MGQTSTLKGQCIAESLDTGLLIFFSAGYVVVLKITGAGFGQWEISIVWGLSVAMAVYLTTGASGTHLNPAVTIALWLFACSDGRKVVSFIISQSADTFCTTALVYGSYYNLFLDYETTHHAAHGSVENLDLIGIFSTHPNPHINFVQAFAVEMVTIAILMGVILALTDDGNGVSRGPLAPLLIGLLIAATSASMGPLTGFAMNPTRGIGPKTFTWLTDWGDAALTGGKDIPYFPVSLCVPMVGAALGASNYRKLTGRHLPCDACVDEGQQNPSSSITQHKASL